MHLKVLPAGQGCWLLTWSASGTAQEISDWLQGSQALQVARDPVSRRRLQVFRSRDPPAAIHRMANRFDRFTLQVYPDGHAILQITTEGEDLDAFTDLAETTMPDLTLSSVEPVPSAGPDGVLTQRQHDALAQALASGYYDVPRKTRLSDLAADMDVSQSSLSELLRRAERRLVEVYMDSTPEPGTQLGTAQTPWSSGRGAPDPWTPPPRGEDQTRDR